MGNSQTILYHETHIHEISQYLKKISKLNDEIFEIVSYS